MKAIYKIFYSWMSDRPTDQCLDYIRNKLREDCKKLEKVHHVKIIIDSDSRGEDGSKSIEENVLKKIADCDLFVGDITPIYPRVAKLWWQKPTPNPNVMYELGFAVSSLGWNRCIMVWNSKYGDLGKAPFDIRNHSTVTYEKGKKELSLYGILKSKIEKYDELVKEWRTGKERSFDAEKYAEINKLFPEREMLESIRHFLTNRVYSRLTFNKWEDLVHTYKTCPDTHFVDEDLHKAYSYYLDALEHLEAFAATNNVPLHSNKYIKEELGSEEWNRNYMYIIKKPFDYISDPDEAYKVQEKMETDINEIGTHVLRSYQEYRDMIRQKLLI